MVSPLSRRQDPQRPFAVDALPARILAQRPDVLLAAERQVLLAQAQTDAGRRGNRLPRLSLQGLVGPGRVWTGRANNGSGPTWTIGPLALTLAGLRRRHAGRAAARLRRSAVDAALSAYQAQVRLAVREVEEALVQLRAAENRWKNSRQAADQARALVSANRRLMDAGLLSQLDFEAVQASRPYRRH